MSYQFNPAAFGLTPAPQLRHYNTGTNYDMMTGKYVPGMDGCAILNGGITGTSAVQGRQQMFKSTTAMFCVMNAAARYDGSSVLLNDTEYAHDPARVVGFVNIPVDMSERTVVVNPSVHTAEEIYEITLQIMHDRIKRQKELMAPTPFIDPTTGKQVYVMRPMFIAHDSFSKMRSAVFQSTLETHGPSSEKTNTMHMQDGQFKNKMMSHMGMMAVKAGMYHMLTAHVGDKIEMNPYAPTPKTLQHMKASEKPVSVGKDYSFLVNSVRDMRRVELLQSKDKSESLYPSKLRPVHPTEMSRATSVMVRCKNNMSGTVMTEVISQVTGVDTHLSYYDHLASSDRFGIIGGDRDQKCVLYPEGESFTRRTINDTRDPKLTRALEIISQLLFVQQHWSLVGPLAALSIAPERLYEQLMKTTDVADHILTSRGWWTFTDSELHKRQQFLSLADVVELANGTYRPKWIPIKAVV